MRITDCAIRAIHEVDSVISKYRDKYCWASGADSYYFAGAFAGLIEGLIGYGVYGPLLAHLRPATGMNLGHLVISQGQFAGDPDRQSNCLIDSPLDALLVDCYSRRSQPFAMIGALIALHYGANTDVMVDGPLLLLQNCAQDGAADFCALLLDFGGDVEGVTIEEDFTPLMWAARAGSVATVKLLLDRGANPKHASCGGETALNLAMSASYCDVVDLLRQ